MRRLVGSAGLSRPLVLSAAAFTSGAVLLSVEIAASRVLAPFFGNSLFVWGALIGVVLTGLSVGYWLGGLAADRVPAPALMIVVMALGAASVLAVPLVDESVLDAVVRWDPGPRANPLVAAVLLFGIPSVVLAAVTPIAVRLLAQTVETLGATAGRLFAISTFGSIVGTFVTAFWLVPELGIDQLLAFAAATLFLAATLFALSERLWALGLAVAVALTVSTATGFTLAPETGGRLSESAARNWSPLYRRQSEGGRRDPIDFGADANVRYRKQSRYHQIAVVDEGDTRYLRFDSSFQSAMYLADPYRTRFDYTDYLQLSLAYNPDARRILVIGLGGASAPKRMWRDFPDVQIEVAELDPAVVDVARRFFGFREDERLKVATEDGRRFLARRSDRWDAIIVDAYFSDSVPFHLTTTEFVQLARSRLEPGGVVVANIIGAMRGEGSQLFRALWRTYRTVFPTVVVHPVLGRGDDPESILNLILVATEGAAPNRAFLTSRWREIRAEHPRAPDLTRAIANRRLGPFPTDDVPVLTDDYAPTDALLLDDF
ncbi:MAG: fused MFS/spermidine synthase [Actinomycetota bacterium]|nr:fused MFS/spermidine synthase [Actinomycetota bacterium]